MPRPVLVTGAGGLLGGRLAQLLDGQGLEAIAVHRDTLPPPGPRAVRAELLEEGALESLLDRLRPEAVVHAAVIGRADLCEQRPTQAEAVNATLPGRLARLCSERGVQLVALSTDLVFPGDAAPYRESEATRPLSHYGRTKRAGEQAVLDGHPRAVVTRIALVLGRGHGPRGTSSESVAWALRSGRPVQLFEDEFRTPVDAESVADAIRRLLRVEARGVFHLGGPERMSRYELGLRVARTLGLDEKLLVRARQGDYAGPDPRPADVSLDPARAMSELGWQPRPVEVAIREGRATPS